MTLGKEIEIGGEMATSEGHLLPAQRPAQATMVSLRSGGVARGDSRHVQTQALVGSGSGKERADRSKSPAGKVRCRGKNSTVAAGGSTNRSQSPGTTPWQSLSIGKTIICSSRSASPLASSLATIARSSPSVTPTGSPPKGSPRVVTTTRKSRIVKASPDGAGASKMSSGNSSPKAPILISLRPEEVGGNTSVHSSTDIPRPVLAPFGCWDPDVGGGHSSRSSARNVRATGYVKF